MCDWLLLGRRAVFVTTFGDDPQDFARRHLQPPVHEPEDIDFGAGAYEMR